MREIRHIIITDPHDCCGCTACASACPRGSITMKEDSEGFLYPSVDESTCIECGICARVCPVITQFPARRPLEVHAVNGKGRQRLGRGISPAGLRYTGRGRPRLRLPL